MKKYYFIILLSIVFTIISCVTILIYFLDNRSSQNNEQSQQTEQPDKQTNNPVTDSSQLTYQTYTNKNLNSFSLDYPSDWVLVEKNFNQANNLDDLFLRYDSSCGINCMALRLKKNEAVLDIVFHKAFDSYGLLCANDFNAKNIGTDWYRITGENEIFYSNSVRLNVTATINDVINSDLSSKDVWRHITEGETYDVCVSGFGVFLEGSEDYPDKNSVLLEFPRLSGQYDTETIQEVDEIILSIEGL